MKKMSKPFVVAMLLVASVALNGEAATDLIINEISPVAPAGGHAWIEFYNPTSEEVILAGLVVGTAETEPFEVPESFPSLRPGGYLLLRFGPGPFGVQIEDGPPQLIVVTAPSRLAEVWLPSSGELMIERPDPMSTEALEFVDYVAWGARGAEWSRVPDRLSRWREHSFVPLAESFGGYDPDTEISPGSSIGLHPGSAASEPENWVLYDHDEASPGARNQIPRPKAFTLEDGIKIGGHSFAAGWVRRKGDDWYRFQLASDPDFSHIIVDERCVNPVMRIGESLPEGRYFFRVSAYSDGVESRMSRTLSVDAKTTTCDWPLPPVPWQSSRAKDLRDWIENAICDGSPQCGFLSSITFKFQRKDTPLLCVAGCDIGRAYPCSWDAPQPYCQKVSLTNARPSYLLCAGGMLSPLCGATLGVGSADVPVALELETIPIPGRYWYRRSEDLPDVSCDHGARYCAMASISMMASAYGKCLSQDRIAYWMHEDDESMGWGQLAHHHEIIHELATSAFKWALGIPDHHFKVDPNPSTVDYRDPSQPAFVAARFSPKNPPIVDFDTIRFWVTAKRPIMFLRGTHYRVLAGYCRDEGNNDWVYVYDPVSGPVLEEFLKWQELTLTAPVGGGTLPNSVWVGPRTSSWTHAISDYGVWSDPDNDGLMDLDENRFGTDPSDPDTDDNPPGDKEEQAP